MARVVQIEAWRRGVAEPFRVSSTPSNVPPPQKGTFLFAMLDICKLVLIFALNVLSARCYIPAVPSNDTEKAITAGLNVTDISKLNLHWFSKGFVVYHFHTIILPICYRSYSENVSFQLAGNGSTGMSRVSLSPLHEKVPFIISFVGRFGSFF